VEESKGKGRARERQEKDGDYLSGTRMGIRSGIHSVHEHGMKMAQ
jgi:hypothetical protein